ATNRMGTHRWVLSFSCGRAFQADALSTRKGRDGGIGAAQRVYYRRVRCHGPVRRGGVRLTQAFPLARIGDRD
ncbi:MAG: fructose-bisphosphate aldolase, partial [Desulfosarcinaceae bacterium]